MFDRGLSQIGDSLTRFGDQISGLGAAITKLTAPIAAMGATGLKVASDFETVMKSIELFGGLAGKELEAARKYVLKLGADTVFSAQDAGEAMLDLLKAGMSYAEASAAIPQVLDLATAGNLSLASAAGIVSAALAQYGLKAKDAKRVSDALAKAANASRADVSDLGQALGNVGPIAASYGLSIEDTAAILGVFANNGIMGAEAGTQLKSMLLNLSRPTDKVKGAFAKLGVSLYDNNGNLRNFNTVVKELNVALNKLPVQEQKELMQDLAGSYGITGLQALRASNGIDDMLQQMKKAPSATQLAAGAANTFARNIESLKGSIETLQIEALTPFMEKTLTPLTKQAVEFVNKLTDWVNKNPVLAQQIVTIGAGLVVLGPALFIAGQAISAIGVVVGFLLSPLGILIGLIVAASIHFGGLDKAIAAATTAAQQLLQIALYEVARILKEASDTAQKLGAIGLVLVTKGLRDAGTAADQLLKMGLLLVADTLNRAATAAGMLATMLILFLTKGLNDAATAADQLLKMGLLLVVDTLNKASVAAGTLGLLIQALVIRVVYGLRDAALDLAGRLVEVSTNLGYLATGLIIILGILTVAKLIAMVQALATAVVAVATAIAGGGGLLMALNPLTLILGVVVLLTLAATTNFMGFGDTLRNTVRPALLDAYESAQKLAGILKAVIDHIQWLSGQKGYETNLPGISVGTQGGEGSQGGLQLFQGVTSDQQKKWQSMYNLTPSGMPARDWGGIGRANMPYLIGSGAQPEVFVPSNNGQFIPNFDKVLAQIAAGGGGGMQFAPGSIVINANSRAEGMAAADGFEQRMNEIRARKGW
ncbi:MAG: phage tail tape measure protein [Bryobacterales bacterium]|nr:phage tail tape measure protein [Bryobacterales bacterium]